MIEKNNNNYEELIKIFGDELKLESVFPVFLRSDVISKSLLQECIVKKVEDMVLTFIELPEFSTIKQNKKFLLNFVTKIRAADLGIDINTLIRVAHANLRNKGNIECSIINDSIIDSLIPKGILNDSKTSFPILAIQSGIFSSGIIMFPDIMSEIITKFTESGGEVYAVIPDSFEMYLLPCKYYSYEFSKKLLNTLLNLLVKSNKDLAECIFPVTNKIFKIKQDGSISVCTV